MRYLTKAWDWLCIGLVVGIALALLGYSLHAIFTDTSTQIVIGILIAVGIFFAAIEHGFRKLIDIL